MSRLHRSLSFGPRGRKPAFTLIELLVVIAIVAILVAILVPVTQRMSARANETKCVSNLRQISASMFRWASEHNGKLPPQIFPDNGLQWNNPGSEFFAYMLDKAGIANDWDELLNTVLRCPGSNAKGTPDGERDNSYGRNTHLGLADYTLPDGMKMRQYETPLTRIEFASKAALVVDWPIPNFSRGTLTTPTRVENLWSRHQGRMNVAYADGHIASITRSQLEQWMGAAQGSQEQRDFRMFLTGLTANNPEF